MRAEARNSDSVIRRKGELHYEWYGHGDEVLLAFHGFGQDKNVYRDWSKKLNTKYRICSFDLFYHGASFREERNLSKNEWMEWISIFLKKEEISQFSILGYSLGGRFAISTAITFKSQVKKLILVAPDGIYLTPWFKVATTPVIKNIMKYVMTHPNFLNQVLNFNDRIRLVNPYLTDFVRKEMNDRDQQKRIFLSWNHFKTLGYTQKQLIKEFQHCAFKKQLILGNRDHIIHPNWILPIIHKIGGFEVTRLPMKHHQLAKQEVADLVK